MLSHYLLIYNLYIVCYCFALLSGKYQLSSTPGSDNSNLRNVTDIGEATMSGKHVRFKIQSEFTCDKNRSIDEYYKFYMFWY